MQEIAFERHARVERIGERDARFHAAAVERRVRVTAEHREARAAAADRTVRAHVRVECVLYRRAFPVLDVVRLVAAGEKDAVGIPAALRRRADRTMHRDCGKRSSRPKRPGPNPRGTIRRSRRRSDRSCRPTPRAGSPCARRRRVSAMKRKPASTRPPPPNSTTPPSVCEARGEARIAADEVVEVMVAVIARRRAGCRRVRRERGHGHSGEKQNGKAQKTCAVAPHVERLPKDLRNRSSLLLLICDCRV